MSQGYLFPFSTCEVPQQHSWIAQPYSLVVNVVSVVVILYFLTQARRVSTRLVLISILLFEAWHAFSHAVHIPGKMQINVIHLLAYAVNLGYLYFLYDISKKFPDRWILVTMVLIVMFDIYAFCNLPFLYYFVSQLVLFLVILAAYREILPGSYLAVLVALVILLVLLFLNESKHCGAMMRYAKFPYHAIIESVGVLIFIVIGSMFLIMEKSRIAPRMGACTPHTFPYTPDPLSV